MQLFFYNKSYYIAEWDRKSCSISVGDEGCRGAKQKLCDTRSVPSVPVCSFPKDILKGVTTYDCRYGPERHKNDKKKVVEKRETEQNQDHPVPRKERMQVFSSVKVACQASTYFCIGFYYF